MPTKGTLRIIAGSLRHRQLIRPIDENIRPTKDRIREALFSILGDINHLSFLDLYAGSGAIGFEALSRGASSVSFVDHSPLSIECIKKNANNLDVNHLIRILPNEDVNALHLFEQEGLIFDIVYIDPPYKEGKYQELVEYLLSHHLISTCGIIALESDHPLNINASYFRKIKEYSYGEIYLTVCWR